MQALAILVGLLPGAEVTAGPLRPVGGGAGVLVHQPVLRPVGEDDGEVGGVVDARGPLQLLDALSAGPEDAQALLPQVRVGQSAGRGRGLRGRCGLGPWGRGGRRRRGGGGGRCARSGFPGSPRGGRRGGQGWQRDHGPVRGREDHVEVDRSVPFAGVGHQVDEADRDVGEQLPGFLSGLADLVGHAAGGAGAEMSPGAVCRPADPVGEIGQGAVRVVVVSVAGAGDVVGRGGRAG